MTQEPEEAAFGARKDLAAYGNNARLLFALELRFQLPDIHSVAVDSLTDGTDDKKCDLVFVDSEAGTVVVAQGYEATDSTKKEAPANKASDLNTAIGWLLNRPLKDLPARIQPAAEQVRSALETGEIQTFQLWYVHNLPESVNVGNELKTAEQSLRATLQSNFPNAEVDELLSLEVGRATLAEWYAAVETPILVSEEISFNVSGAFEEKGQDFTALVTSISAADLHAKYQQHKSKLFSANIRDYLGSRRSGRNVNHGIQNTAMSQPGKFWVFNNGITALTNDYKLTTIGPDKMLSLTGLAIVNGAQTTGAIGTLTVAPSADALIPARFVKCSDQATIRSIIQYNNTQNAIHPTDFRSNDAVQQRLRTEFGNIPNAEYRGGRRGGDTVAITRSPNLLPAGTCGQALLAFHQDPLTAYHKKSFIWENDNTYAKIFSEQTHAVHIVFVYSLLRAVEKKKQDLLAKSQQGQALSDAESEQLAYLRKRGGIPLFVAALARCLETLLNRPVSNVFRVSFGQTAPTTAQLNWLPIVEVALNFAAQLEPGLEGGLRNQEAARKAISQFKRMLDATKNANRVIYDAFAHKVVEDT